MQDWQQNQTCLKYEEKRTRRKNRKYKVTQIIQLSDEMFK